MPETTAQSKARRQKNIEERLFECIPCNKVFSDNFILVRHLKTKYHEKRQNKSDQNKSKWNTNLIELSTADTYDEALKEWVYDDTLPPHQDKSNCLCGAEITNIHIIYNTTNKNISYVGSSCRDKIRNPRNPKKYRKTSGTGISKPFQKYTTLNLQDYTRECTETFKTLLERINMEEAEHRRIALRTKKNNELRDSTKFSDHWLSQTKFKALYPEYITVTPQNTNTKTKNGNTKILLLCKTHTKTHTHKAVIMLKPKPRLLIYRYESREYNI